MVAQPLDHRETATDDSTLKPTLAERLAGYPSEKQMVLASSLEVDHEYQRIRIRWAKVRQIASEFDPFLFDELAVNDRLDGHLAVMDGQHRLLALREMGYGDQNVPCRVYHGLPRELEARMFNRQDDRISLTPQERLKGALAEGRPDALQIVAIVASNGFAINFTGGELDGGKISAVASLSRVYRAYKAGDLDVVLRLIRDAFGVDRGPRGAVIEGIARFNAKFRGDYDRARLVEVLRPDHS